MNPDFIQYTDRDGIANEWKFRGDYLFGTEVLEFVSALPDGKRWILRQCHRVDVEIYLVSFCTNEYLSPHAPRETLTVKVIASEDRDGDWIISPF